MSSISPGAATNSSMSPGVQLEQRATSPETSGTIVTLTKGANVTSAAHSFELRIASDPGH